MLALDRPAGCRENGLDFPAAYRKKVRVNYWQGCSERIWRHGCCRAAPPENLKTLFESIAEQCGFSTSIIVVFENVGELFGKVLADGK